MGRAGTSVFNCAPWDNAVSFLRGSFSSVLWLVLGWPLFDAVGSRSGVAPDRERKQMNSKERLRLGCGGEAKDCHTQSGCLRPSVAFLFHEDGQLRSLLEEAMLAKHHRATPALPARHTLIQSLINTLSYISNDMTPRGNLCLFVHN